MKATSEDIRSAMEAAYRRAGVKEFSVEGEQFVSKVQHSVRRAKTLADDAIGSLTRRGFEVECTIVRSPRGGALYEPRSGVLYGIHLH